MPRLLGTGFFVNADGDVASAAHILDGITDEERASLSAVVHDLEGQTSYVQLTDVRTSRLADVMVGRALGARNIVPLAFSRGVFPTDIPIGCFEWSYTSFERAADGVLEAHFEPYSWHGNAVRHYREDRWAKSPMMHFEMSFALMQGASGAPIKRALDHAVVGMAVTNHERHLLPAQVVRIRDDDGNIEEEVRYFLPLGVALGADGLLAALDELRVTVATVQ